LRKKKNQYAIYDVDDMCVCVGNAQECSHYLGITLHHFYSKLSVKGNNKFKIYKLEEDTNE
jgi:hypothetical protein